ncbi:sigma-70 family RNA polymerase sigma factor [Streptomyces sp. M19]
MVEGEDLALLADALRAGPDVHQRVDGRIDTTRALAALPPRQREALHLHYVDDLTVAQTATLMGVSVNGVKNLLKKALERLRTTVFLDSYGAEGSAGEPPRRLGAF